MQIRSVGIVGTGLMGTGIAWVAALKGHRVTIVKYTPGDLLKVRMKFYDDVERLRAKDKLSMQDHMTLKTRIEWSADLGALADCDLVIEAIIEDEAEKLKCFAAIEPVLKQSAILATTTSSLSVAAMAKATGRPRLFLGLHFFNPPPKMRLVELVTTDALDAGCLHWMRSFLAELGKEDVEVRDAPGFVVNRLLVVQFLEAIRMAFAEPPVASIAGIDACMKLGANHPMGPFELMDFIGLDVVLAMTENLQEGLRQQHFSPPALLEDMVGLGWLGRKAGVGFYDYADRKNPRPNPDLYGLTSCR